MSKTYKIALIPGDGTGPEVINEGVKVINAVAAKTGISAIIELREAGFIFRVSLGNKKDHTLTSSCKKNSIGV